MRVQPALLQLLQLLLLSVSTVLAVFSDEAFQTDWKIKQIGQLTQDNVVSPNHEVLSLLSTTNTLAGVRNGIVKWSVTFDNLNPDASQHLIPFGDSYLTTGLNLNDRSIIQIWDAEDGFLVRDLIEFESELKEIESDHEGHILAVFTNGRVAYIENSGKIVFENVIEYSTDVKIASYQNGHFSILYNKGNEAFLAFYDGVELKTQLLNGVPYDSIRDFYGSKIVYETDRYNVLQIDKNIGVISKPVRLPKIDVFVPKIQTDEYYAFEKDHNLEVYTIDGKPHFTIPNVYKYNFKFVDSVFILYTEYHANIVDADTGIELQSYFLGDSKVDFDQIDTLNTATNGIDEIHSLIKFTNDTYSYFLNDQIIWTRDISLSEVLAHAVVDLPIDSSITYDQILYEEEQNILSAYLYRLKRHFFELKDTYEHFWELLPGWVTGDWRFSAKKNDKYFGFEKYLVLGTKSGRVVAINTLEGTRSWSYDTGHDDILQIENIRNEKLYVFTKSGPRFILDALTGELLDKNIVSPPQKIVKLEEDSFLLELENGFDVVLSEKTLEDKYIVKQQDRSIQGFKIHNRQAKPTWSFDITIDEEIVGFALKDSEEVVANVGIVLGDRRVLYKYLYPNLAALGVFNKLTQTLYIHIIDTITGEILHSTFHDEQVHNDERFNIIFGEHWVVYSYWSNLPTPEQKIVVIDLFESLVPDQRLSSKNSTSSFDARVLPAVLSRSFILPYRIKSLGISKTKHGVTTKAIIVALENHQIFYLPKYVLNSRRVEGRPLTADEKQEFMLLPYDPVITIDDNTVISHNREVIGNDVIVSIPTNLESTSIVCTYGLDVFCTRIQPSLQYDKLTPSFDKRKLVFSVAVLAFIIAVLRPLVVSKKLKSLWIQEKQ